MNQAIQIGKDITIKRIGLGTNRLTQSSKDILKKAVEAGIKFFDTADTYTGGQSETTIGSTLYPYEGITIATKGGMIPLGVDGSPEHLRKALEGSLKRLRKGKIDLYFLHRVDPNVPLKESILCLKELQSEGKINHIGLSEVTIEQIEEARKYIEVAAVENEYNLMERKHEEVLEYCTREEIPFLPWFPLERGNTDHELVEELSKKYGATSAQITLAWLLQKSHIMLPIPGTLSPQHLEENLKAFEIELEREDMEALNNL